MKKILSILTVVRRATPGATAFFQYFYAGDNLDHPQWDPRSLSGHARLSDKEKIALLAFELASRIG